MNTRKFNRHGSGITGADNRILRTKGEISLKEAHPIYLTSYFSTTRSMK